MKEMNIKQIINQFIKASNAFDVETALKLFAADAVIDDVSVGENLKTQKVYVNTLRRFSLVTKQ
jgi:ketosteroid isomerase-like protein